MNNTSKLPSLLLAGILTSSLTTQAAVVARYDASGLSAGAITTWADSSGNGYDATNTGDPTVVAGAQNGLAVVNFDGTDYFTIPDSYTIGTAFSVAKYSNSTFNFFDGLFSGDGSAGGAGTEIYWSGNRNSTALWQETALDNRYLNGTLSEQGNPGSFNLYSGVDASTQTLPGYIIGGDRTFGVSRAWEGDIAEIILFDTALSDFDRKGVEVYLDEKWGLGQGLRTSFGESNFNTLAATGNFSSVIPEPGSYALLAGLTGLVFVMLRRRRR
ncbi:PEP-CTERM sorting domain-containing protein [Puniceicoccaceae bacterium]|nr:PEP-CTERM sorting domain-containing protein [Puniceicoccaceae bacterium]